MAYDPYYQLVPEPKEPPFDPDRTAFIIIDLHNGCGHPDGLMGRLAQEQGKPWLLKERFDFTQEILPNVRRLLVEVLGSVWPEGAAGPQPQLEVR